MNVDELYILGQYIVGKNTAQGYYSPDDFNNTINAGQDNYTSFLLGTFQKYTPGRPVANVELGQNSVVRQRLSPIIYGYNLAINQTTGISNYPGDYLQTDAIWSIYGYRRIRFADQHKFVSIYNSVIDPISSNPIYTLNNTFFNFFPSSPYNLTQAKLNYVRTPPRIIWGYDEDVNGLPVYNASKSTQPVWDDLSLYEILSRAMGIVGINLQSQAIMQLHSEIKNVGQ